MRNCLVIPALLYCAAPAIADDRPSLCNTKEAPAFSCATGGKIVSLCASGDLGEKQGTLTYRFGTKRRIELQYPAPGTKPQAAFKGGVTGYSGGGADFIRFKSGDATYTLYSDHYRGNESDGLTVERGGKTIAAFKCRAPAVNPREGWGRIYKAKLPRSTDGFDVPGVGEK